MRLADDGGYGLTSCSRTRCRLCRSSWSAVMLARKRYGSLDRSGDCCGGVINRGAANGSLPAP